MQHAVITVKQVALEEVQISTPRSADEFWLSNGLAQSGETAYCAWESRFFSSGKGRVWVSIGTFVTWRCPYQHWKGRERRTWGDAERKSYAKRMVWWSFERGLEWASFRTYNAYLHLACHLQLGSGSKSWPNPLSSVCVEARGHRATKEDAQTYWISLRER